MVLDTDNDGSPNHLDLDSDGDFITDLTEAGGADTDANGRVDDWAETGGAINSDGFIPFSSAPITDATLPDLNDNNIPDVLEIAQEPAVAGEGEILTGLTGGGCAIGGVDQKADPFMMILLLVASAWLALTRFARSSANTVIGNSANVKKFGVIGAVVGVSLLSGCSSFGGLSRGSLSTGSSSVSSSQSDDRMRRTVYAAVGLGVSGLEPDTSRVPDTFVDEKYNAGGQVTIGADLTKHFSLELHSADLGSAGISPAGRINYHMHGGSALFYVGKNRHKFKRNGLTGFGRIGYGVLENSPVGDVDFRKVNGNQVLIGAGLEYMTRMGLGVRAEAISFDEDVQYAQLGLIYRLGKRQQRAPAQIVKTPAPAPEIVQEVMPVAPPVLTVQVPEPVYVESNACDQFNGVIEGVNFHSGSEQLTDAAQQILVGIVDSLNQCGSPMLINAHTDSQGAEAYNKDLSSRRARSVAKFLVQNGIDVNRLQARAYGESQPIDSNDTDEGRRRNRRVELIAQ